MTHTKNKLKRVDINKMKSVGTSLAEGFKIGVDPSNEKDKMVKVNPPKNAEDIISEAKKYLNSIYGNKDPESLFDPSPELPIHIIRDLLMLVYIRGAEIEKLRKGVS